ncbi:MAG: hypothetical protein ABI336_07675 [Humibacillus sp.]
MNLTTRLGPATGVPWRPVAALASTGVSLLFGAAVWLESSVASTVATVGVLLLASATAYVLDEAAGEAVAAVPSSLRARSAARLLVAAAVVAMGALVLAAGALLGGLGAGPGITVQLAGLALVAVAASAAMRRRVAEPGEAVAGGLIAVVLALELAHPLDRWVELFPSQPGQRWAGSLLVWSVVAGVSIAGLYAATRDPLERTVGARRTRSRALR